MNFRLIHRTGGLLHLALGAFYLVPGLAWSRWAFVGVLFLPFRFRTPFSDPPAWYRRLGWALLAAAALLAVPALSRPALRPLCTGAYGLFLILLGFARLAPAWAMDPRD